MATRKEIKMNQTAGQYNKELMYILGKTGKGSLTLEFLKKAQKILQKQGGIVFDRAVTSPIKRKSYEKAI